VPTYDYVCTACGHEVEVVHPLHGAGPSACPVCGSPMRKSFAPLAVHFKGSGWARKERGPSRSSGKARGPAAAGEVATAKEAGPSPSPSASSTAGEGN
jgi:putative FmdB family regulatory protein